MYYIVYTNGDDLTVRINTPYQSRRDANKRRRELESIYASHNPGNLSFHIEQYNKAGESLKDFLASWLVWHTYQDDKGELQHASHGLSSYYKDRTSAILHAQHIAEIADPGDSVAVVFRDHTGTHWDNQLTIKEPC